MRSTLLNHPNVPRYVKLAEELRVQIRSRQLLPGDRLPSFTDMRSSGVSQNTLERVHALLEREGLVVRERGKGVFVSRTVRIETPTVGLVQEAFTQRHHAYYFAEMLAGIQEMAHLESVRLSLLGPQPDDAQWGEVDGVLLFEGEPGRPAAVIPEHVPRVGMLLPDDGGLCVNISDAQGIRDVTDYLLNLGHRRIAFLHLGDHPSLPGRVRAYQEALEGAGGIADPRWVRGKSEVVSSRAHRIDQGRESMADWLAHDWTDLRCTALLVQNDFMAVGALEALRDAGIRVPEDLSVVGFDGLEICDVVTPRLTTVEVPLRKVGSTALQLLLGRIRHGDVEPPDLIHTRLVVKDSTSPPTLREV